MFPGSSRSRHGLRHLVHLYVMDRVRTGLTGLGLVFLFTLAASAMLSPQAPAPKGKEASEPLAQLGVAPGADKAQTATTNRNGDSPLVIVPRQPGYGVGDDGDALTERPVAAVPGQRWGRSGHSDQITI